jgi:hypothetical protein
MIKIGYNIQHWSALKSVSKSSQSQIQQIISTVVIIGYREHINVRFKVFTAVTMKNGIFWDVTLCGSCSSYKSHAA